MRRNTYTTDEPEDFIMELEDENSDRLFTFEVAKTNEQEEDVTVRTGFKVSSPATHAHRDHSDLLSR